MDSPINRMIDRNFNRKVAQSTKAKAKRTKALNDQVLSLVHAANETALPERHVTPRAALIVMARAMKELASLPEESRNYGVLREVTKFISLNQKTLLASVSTKHADLLPKGHPLSPLNASLTDDDLRKKYSAWIAADPAIADDARPLVAMAHSLPPESIEREHAFLRLRTLQASAVPAYFKIDDVTALVAAFSAGNSSAARRARVALQWRDRFGRWVEMGRGINFRFRLPDGSIQVARGNYVGAGSNSIVERTATGTSLTSEFGLIEVSGVPGLAPGLYPVGSSNAAVYQARIPGMEAPEEPSFKDQFDQDIPSVSDLSASRKDLPIGWKKQGPYYVSDDNYAVIPGPTGRPQAVTRLSADGRPSGTVGNARDWSEVNALIEKDQPEFDKEIARLEEEDGQLPLARIPGATAEDVIDGSELLKMQEQRAQENKAFDESRGAPRPLGNKDINGNVVPEGWTRNADDDTRYTREMPLRDGGTYPLLARADDDGTYIFGHSSSWMADEGSGGTRRFASWDEIEKEGIPGFVDYLNDTFTKDNPITLAESAPAGKPVGTPASELRPGDKVKHKGEWKTIKSIDKLNLGSRLNFEDGTSDDIGIKSVQAIRKPDATGGALVDNRDGTFRYKGVTFKKVFGKWVSARALDPAIGKNDTIEDAMAKIDALDAAKAEKPSAPSAPAAERPRFGEGYGEDTRTGRKSPLTPGKTAGDLTKIDKSTLDALSKRMREDSTGEYNMEGVTFAPDNNGNIVMYPDAWEPGDKIIGRIEDDGGIDWESDAQYDKYAEKVTEALRGIGTPDENADNLKTADSILDFLDKHMDDKGTTEADAMGISNVQDLVKKAKKYLEEGNTKEAISSFRDAYDVIVGNDSPGDGVFRNGTNSAEAEELLDNLISSLRGESDYSVSFEALRDEETLIEAGLDPDGEYEDSEILDAWLKAKGLDGRVKVKSLTEGYGGPESVLEIPEEAKADFVKGYGNFEPGVTFDDLVEDGMISKAPGQGASGARFAEGNSGNVIITNSIKKDPNGAFSEVFMGDYMEPFNTDDPWLDEVVKAANKLGIHVDFAPSQSGAYLSDEGVFRFTLSGPELTPEQAKDFMGDGPDDAGVFGAAFSGINDQEGFEDTSWQNLYNALTGGPTTWDKVQLDLGDYENSPEFIKQANEITKDWPTMSYATYINDKDPEFVKHKYMPLPEGSKLIATGLNGEDGSQLLVKLPDGNYILANDVLDISDEDMKNNVGIPAFEQIFPASAEEPGGGYGENNLSWEDMTLERLTSGDPYSGFDRLDEYGYFERFGIPKQGDGGPGEPPSGPTTPSGDYGSDFTSMVIDGAESQYFMDRELEEMLDEEDVLKTGLTFTDIMWDSANDRFDLQDQFDGNRPIDLNKSEFIEAAVAAFNKDVNSNLESAFEERLDSDPEYDTNSFDSDKFKATAERQYRDRLESLFEYDDDEGSGEPPTPPSGPGSNPDFTNRFKEVKELAESGSPTPQEFFNALFKDAKYRLPTSKELKDYGMPEDSKVFYVDEQDTFVQHSDGTWHNYDLDAPGESAGDKGTYDFFIDNFVGATDDLSMVFYRGAFIDRDLQLAVEKQRDGEGPGEPPTPPSGGGDNTPGGGFTDYVIDLAEDDADLDKDLEEKFDGDAEEAGIELMDQIYEDASRRYELSQDIADNKPAGMSDDEFVRDAVAKMREQLKAIVDSAIEGYQRRYPELRDVEDGEVVIQRSGVVDFDKKAFIDAGAKRFEELLREELDNMGDDDEGPDEPPSPGGGTPPKVPSPSTPGSPALFGDFDKPAGAFQLRTTEYEPEGRIDEESADFTDDPRRLATKFTLDELVTALTEALIGRPSDDAMQDILDANVGDDDDLPDLDDLESVANSPARRAGEVSGTGTGALEFSAGEEYVQAEALYNAVYEAGGDPNRVIANAYDAANGNRNNARKLLDAQGGVSSPEDAQLIEDMTDEIRQIKDATPDDDISVAQKRSKPEKKTTGSLIENAPVDYDNPDFFDMDTYAYIPSVPDIDESGYTDNPEIISTDYETADLIEQMIEAITDGSGVVLLDFGGDAGAAEVPVEAVRDALQLLNINTNEILFNLRDESNDMEDNEKPEAPTLAREDIRWDAQKGLYTDVNGKVLDGDTVDAAGLDSSLRDAPAPDIKVLPSTEEQDQAPATPAEPQGTVEFAPFSDALANLDEEDPSTSPETVLMLDDAANAIVDMFSNGMPSDASFVAYNANNGIILFKTGATDLEQERVISMHPNGAALGLESNTDWFLSPQGETYGWRKVPDDAVQAIRQENARRYPGFSVAEKIAATESAPAPAPAFMYPGPREAGYSVNNTTLASDGSVVGAGSIVIANRDSKRGTVVSVQNDPEYVRIRFDDGKIAVRSANQIKAVSNPDGSLALAPSGSLAPSPAVPSTDVEARLEAPILKAPNIARSGASWGINDTSEIPEAIQPLVQQGVQQSDFSAWGSRDAEIAKAATTRASLISLVDAAGQIIVARENGDMQGSVDATKQTRALIEDIYGARSGVSFGVDGYRISPETASSYTRNTIEEIQSGNAEFRFAINFEVQNKNGGRVGEGTRTVYVTVKTGEAGNKTYQTSVKNEILKIRDEYQKKGFASAYNRYMENWYIANGIDKVKVYAAGGGSWDGAFVWALNGFDWDASSGYGDPQEMVGALRRRARSDEEKAIAAKLASKVDAADGDFSKMPTPLEVALVGWYPGAESWLGKEVLIQRSWHGVKHLKPDAREQKQAANYNQIKNAERRIRSGQNKANMSGYALTQIMDNDFQDKNPGLSPHIEAVRDALRNNRPLGFLSPAAKAALNTYVSDQLRDKSSLVPMDDLFRLRNALDAEYRADYDFADPFGGVGDALADFSLDDYLNNSDALKAVGFESLALSEGQNNIFRVTHKASGQVFFVKEEHLSRDWDGERGLTREVEASTLMNALGMHGISDVRASRANEDIFIMSQSGATLPLTSEPVNAEEMFYNGITEPVNGINMRAVNGTFVDALSNPEDILSMSIIDMLGDSADRHDANWMVAFDSTTNRLRMFPIDHGLNQIETDSDVITPFLAQNWPSAGGVYQVAIPRLIDLAGEARTKEMFLNQVDKLITNLDNPLFQPKGQELAALIEKWGSYDAFKDAMKERLTRIVTPGTDENDALGKSMKRNYWR